MHGSLMRRSLVVASLMASAVVIPWSPATAQEVAPAAVPAQPPATPVWPVPDLRDDIRELLRYYYGQRADPAVLDYTRRAPTGEAAKKAAWKDPDTLWEYFGAPDTRCHAATTDAQLLSCVGFRLYRSVPSPSKPPYSGGLTLFDARLGYHGNEAYALIAGFNALYHAFVLAHDAPDDFPGYTAAGARSNKAYHRRMLKAYEAHMRNILIKFFIDPAARNDPFFQASTTRSLGLVAGVYVHVAQAMEEYRVWSKASGDRRFALATINGIDERLFWEWVYPLRDGPPTAGLTGFGSQATFDAAAAGRPDLAGTDRFNWDAMQATALRPAAQNTAPNHGLWVDSDFTVPGEWWCHGRYAGTPVDRDRCLSQAIKESLGGSRSPFGQFFGTSAACNVRAGGIAPSSCADTSLGSVAEEYAWSFLGARKGLFLVRGVSQAGGVGAPAAALGGHLHEVSPGVWRTEYELVTDRLGYGISGWHGGAGRQDDMEWIWNRPDGQVQAIRTLSAGPHDFEQQTGRYSLGEDAVSPHSTGRDGDTWAADGQDMPGGMENHSPGPSPLYGTGLFGTALWDKVSAGLSGSLYDNAHRNHPDEFASWIWLLIASYHRCPGVADPTDDRCGTFDTSRPPFPPTIVRRALYTAPDDGSVPLAYRYLWRDPARGTPGALLPATYIADGAAAAGAGNCRGSAGLPWRSIWDYTGGGAGGPGPYLLEEGGFGAYNELVQGLGGFMRVAAARYPLPAPAPDLAAAYASQRSDVIAPWYDLSYRTVKGILAAYRDPVGGYGYVPDIENSTCRGNDPTTPAVDDHMLTWGYATGTPVADVVARRAQWYATLAVWNLWYDTSWLDVDPSVWLAP